MLFRSAHRANSTQEKSEGKSPPINFVYQALDGLYIAIACRIHCICKLLKTKPAPNHFCTDDSLGFYSHVIRLSTRRLLGGARIVQSQSHFLHIFFDSHELSQIMRFQSKNLIKRAIYKSYTRYKNAKRDAIKKCRCQPKYGDEHRVIFGLLIPMNLCAKSH